MPKVTSHTSPVFFWLLIMWHNIREILWVSVELWHLISTIMTWMFMHEHDDQSHRNQPKLEFIFFINQYVWHFDHCSNISNWDISLTMSDGQWFYTHWTSLFLFFLFFSCFKIILSYLLSTVYFYLIIHPPRVFSQLSLLSSHYVEPVAQVTRPSKQAVVCFSVVGRKVW